MLRLYIFYIPVIALLFIVVLLLAKALNVFIAVYNDVNTCFKCGKMGHWAKKYISGKVNIINVLLIHFLKVIL